MILKIPNKSSLLQTRKKNLHISSMHQYIANHYTEIVYWNIVSELKIKFFLKRSFSRKWKSHTTILFIGIISTIIITITYPCTRYTSITTIKLWIRTSWISYSIIYFNFQILIFYILQFRSSDESLQSAIRLQRHDNGIHRPPVSHRHSLIPQAPKIE